MVLIEQATSPNEAPRLPAIQDTLIFHGEGSECWLFSSQSILQVIPFPQLMKLNGKKPPENSHGSHVRPWFPPSGEHQGLRPHLQLASPVATLRSAERITGPNRMRRRLGHTLTLDPGTASNCQQRHRPTLDLPRSLPWSKGTAAIGML